jgi:threonine synthase
VRRLKQEGFLSAEDRIVMLNTGAGIKYPDTISDDLPYVGKDDTLLDRQPDA